MQNCGMNRRCNASSSIRKYVVQCRKTLGDEQALQCFQQHPLHAAHRERCKDLVTARLCGDVRVDTN